MQENNLFHQELSASLYAFGAVKSLVQANEQLRVIQNRVRVLHLKENSNSHRSSNSFDHQAKCLKALDAHYNDEHKIKLTRQQNEQRLEKQKAINQQRRNEHAQRMSLISGQIMLEKEKSYRCISKLRDDIQKKIKASRRKELTEKRQNKIFIEELKQASKENFCKYHQQKMDLVHQSIRKEVQGFRSQVMQRFNLIKTITSQEQELLKTARNEDCSQNTSNVQEYKRLAVSQSATTTPCASDQ